MMGEMASRPLLKLIVDMAAKLRHYAKIYAVQSLFEVANNVI